MKKYFIIAYLLGVYVSSYAQKLRIIDAVTLEPLAFVTVFNPDASIHAISDVDGIIDFTPFIDESKIIFRLFGFEIQEKNYEEAKASQFIIMLTANSLLIDQVVISATRWRQSSSKTPVKVSQITAKEVQLQNPQTAADLLALSGKVFIQKSQQGGGSPMIRGFATNRLLYTIDGVRMNTAIFRGGNIQNVLSIDPFTLSSTEVLFGPGSVIYGSDAIGGVMSFRTLQHSFSLDSQIQLSGNAVARFASANNENMNHFDVQISNKRWSMITSISHWEYDHLKQGGNGPDDYLKSFHVIRLDNKDVVKQQDNPLLQIPTAYSQVNLMQKFAFNPNEKWQFSYGLHYSETSPYGRYDRHNRMKDGFPRYSDWRYGQQKWMMNMVEVAYNNEHKLYDKWNFRIALQNFEESRIDRSWNAVEENNQVEKVDAYSVNLDFMKKASERIDVTYGLEYIINQVHSSGEIYNVIDNTSEISTPRYPRANWQTIAAYLNTGWAINEKINLQTGVRVSQNQLESTFDTSLFSLPFSYATLSNQAITGSFGLVYRPSSQWSISSHLSTAFRAPNVDDMGKVFDSEPGAITVPNENLSSEYAYNADLSIVKLIGKKLKIDATVFYTYLDKALVRRNFKLLGRDSLIYQGEMSKIQAMQNASFATIYGLQIGMEWKMAEGLSLSSDVNFQEGKEELDNGEQSWSRHAAPVFGNVRFHYKLKKMRFQLYYLFQGEKSFDQLAIEEQGKDEIYAKDAQGRNYAPAWSTINFKALVPIDQRWTLTVGLENILDRRYRPYSSGVSAAGRNFILSVQAKF